MSILNYKKYTEKSLNEVYQDEEDDKEEKEIETGIDFQDSMDLLNWLDTLKDSPNSEIKNAVNSMNPLYFRTLQRLLVKRFDEGELDTIEDAEKFILKQKEPKKELVLEKRVLHPTEYDVYLKDKEFMNYFNKVKDKILQLFPTHNISNIDLLIDKIHPCYLEKFEVDDTVNKLYMGGWLYSFWVSNLDL